MDALRTTRLAAATPALDTNSRLAARPSLATNAIRLAPVAQSALGTAPITALGQGCRIPLAG